MNGLAIKKIGWIIRQMESRSRDAPVFEAEGKTHGNPFKILVFTMLSARTKDSTTIKAVEKLFSVADSPQKIARLPKEKLEKILYGVGFYRVKSKNLIQISKRLAVQGSVPDNLEDLLKLPGIGRKTANIILARAFGQNAIGVDVHVHRISNRLGIVKTEKPHGTERELLRIIPPEHLRLLNRNFVAFGQTVCTPRKPHCGSCPLNALCYRIGVKERCAGCKYGIR